MDGFVDFAMGFGLGVIFLWWLRNFCRVFRLWRKEKVSEKRSFSDVEGL
jgi:hypothetical protein